MAELDWLAQHPVVAPDQSAADADWLAKHPVVAPTAAPTAGPPRPDTLNRPLPEYGAQDAVIHGMTLGLSDIARSGMRTVGQYAGGNDWDYGQAAKDVATARENFAREHPWASGASNLLGGVLGGNAAGALIAPTRVGQAIFGAADAAPGMIRQMLTSMGIGAGTGAVQGAADNPDNMAAGAGQGAAFGGVLGAAAPPLLSAGQAVYRGARNLWNPAGRAPENAVTALRTRMGEDTAAGFPDPAAIDARLAASDAPLNLLDVSGAKVRGYGGALYNTNTPASNVIESALEQRDRGAGGRLLGTVDQTVSAGPEAYQADKLLSTQQRTTSQPLYDAAMSPGKPIYSDRLQQFIDSPRLQAGLKLGATIQRDEALAAGRPFDPNDYAIRFNAAGDPEFFGTPNMRGLDMAKRGLDALINQRPRDMAGNVIWDAETRAIDQVRKAYIGELDSLNPSYATARAAWSGPEASRTAMEQGQDFLNPKISIGQQRDIVSALSPGDQEFYRLGAADKLRQQIRTAADAGDESKRIANSQDMRDRLRPLFDSDAEYNRFIGTVGDERTMFNTRTSILGNSATARRVGEMGANFPGADAVSSALPTAIATTFATASPVAGGVAGLSAAAAQRGKHWLQDVMARARGETPQMQITAANMLTAPGPAARQVLGLLSTPQQQMLPSYYVGPTMGAQAAGGQVVSPMLRGLLGY